MIFKSKLRIVVGLLLLLVAAIAFYVVSENIRGGNRLEKARSAYIADGGSFDRKSLFASPVPDAENFGAIPLLKGIAEDSPSGQLIRDELEKIGLKDSSYRWPRSQARRKHGHEPFSKHDLEPFNQFFVDLGLLDSLSETDQLETDLFKAFEAAHGPAISQLQAASTRPSALLLPLAADRFVPGSLMINETYVQLTSCQSVSKGVMLHAILALRTGATDSALADIRVMNQLSMAVQADERTLISHLVGNAIVAMSISVISEGLADRRWTDNQLKELQTLLSSRNFLLEVREAIKSEVIFMDEVFANLDKSLAGSPGIPSKGIMKLAKPWMGHNHAEMLELYHQGIIVPSRLPNGYVQAANKSEALISKLVSGSKYNPRTILARLTAPATGTFIKKTARTDSEMSLAAAACALELYYLSNQNYPEKFEALVPEFITEVPIDPGNGKPLTYQKTPTGRYSMYSVGADGIDNWGGKGDITWNYETAPPTPPQPKRTKKSRTKRSAP